MLDDLILHQGLWLSAPLAVSLSVVGMLVTKTLHPPGGGTALTALMGPASVQVGVVLLLLLLLLLLLASGGE